MKYGQTWGVLKPLDELVIPDPRIETEWYRPRADSPLSAADIHVRLETYSRLHAGVPERVKTQFEVARNLMLYTYFVFEFQTQAELQAYAALEFALRERLGNPTKKVKRGKKTQVLPLMLRELLQKAVQEKLVQPERLPSWDWNNQRGRSFAESCGGKFTPTSPEKWIEFVVRAIAQLRNHIAHGNPHLHFPNSFDQLELCADIINALFRDPGSSTSEA